MAYNHADSCQESAKNKPKPQATNQWGSKGLVRRDTSVAAKKAETVKTRNAGMALVPEYESYTYSRFVQGNEVLKDKKLKKLHATNLFGKPLDPQDNFEGLKKEFLFPPFSVLNSREGAWQARKRAWNRLEVKSIGEESLEERSGGDPVLCELMCKWFCPPGGRLIDPFAGSGSWGITSTVLGYNYFGVDINEKQVAANQAKAKQLLGESQPTWINGDSRQIVQLTSDFELNMDMILSCPPYANLEVYSNHEQDISTLNYPEFLVAYRKIIRRTCSLLKDNRFVVWIVGEIRDSDTAGKPYHGFVSDTIAAFKEVGLAYYNEMILVTAVGSLPVRTRRAFVASRKIGKTHQTILIFVKGDPKKAAEACNG